MPGEEGVIPSLTKRTGKAFSEELPYTGHLLESQSTDLLKKLADFGLHAQGLTPKGVEGDVSGAWDWLFGKPGPAEDKLKQPKPQLPGGAYQNRPNVSPAEQLSQFISNTLAPYAQTAQADVTKMGDFANDPFFAGLPKGLQQAYQSTESGVTQPLSAGITAATALGTQSPQANLINQLLQLIQSEARYATLPSTLVSPTPTTYASNPGLQAILNAANAAAQGVTGSQNIFGSGTSTSTGTPAATGPGVQPKTP